MRYANNYFDPVNSSTSSDLNWSHKLQWFLQSICANISIVISIVYWSFLRIPLPIIYDLSAHTFPALLGVIDIIMTPIPVKLQHVVYPLVYAAIYALFTVVYWAAGGRNIMGETAIYPGLVDYATPGVTCIALVGIAVAIVVCQVALWGLYRVKLVVINRYVRKGSSGAASESEAPPSVDNPSMANNEKKVDDQPAVDGSERMGIDGVPSITINGKPFPV